MKKITEGFESQIVPVLDSGGRPTGRYSDSSAPEMEIINLPRDKHFLQIDFPCGFWIVDNYGDRVYHSANSWVIDVYKLLPVKWQENKPKFQIFLEYNPEELAGRDYRINTTNLDISAVSGVNGQVVTISEESGAMVAILEQLRQLNSKISAECGIQVVYPLDKTPLEATKEKYVNKVGSATLLDGRRVDGALVTDVVTEGGETYFIVQYPDGVERGNPRVIAPFGSELEEEAKSGNQVFHVPVESWTDVAEYDGKTYAELEAMGVAERGEFRYDGELYQQDWKIYPRKIKVAKAYAYGDSFAIDRAATDEKAAELAQVAEEEEARFREEQERLAREKEEEERKKAEEEDARKRAERIDTGEYVFLAYGEDGAIVGGAGDYGKRGYCGPYNTRTGDRMGAWWRLYRDGYGTYYADNKRVEDTGKTAGSPAMRVFKYAWP